MSELLFEIFCEEIPARMQLRAGEDLTKALTAGLEKAGLTVENAHCYTGPRRLVFACELPARSPDVSEDRKGPRVGSPEKALEGFMRGAGLSDISQAQIRSDKKGQFYVAVIEKKGVQTQDILKDIIPDVMTHFPWPKSMKSGISSFRWVRPLQSLICLLDGEIVPIEVGGVTTGDMTYGHRRHGKGPFTVTDFADYRRQLETIGHVMICTCERKDKILKDAQAVCAAKGLELVEDAGLLQEVAGLVEWPVVILGDMDPSFLELPGEVIRLSMRTHQKYFAVRDPKTGEIAPHFVVVANQIAPDGGKAISEGNSRVLSARLGDAQFFQREDAKKKLSDYYDKLDTVVFHKDLGSIRDKADLISRYAYELADKVGANEDAARTAGTLAKCDLVTQTVVEFTSLQGQIGAGMYRVEGGHADIADAIENHYKPQGPKDIVPTQPVAVCVALADKFNTLAGFWAIDEKPTGSKDPYALRRAALGVVRIILENDIRDLTLTDRLGAYMRDSVPGVADSVLKAKDLMAFILDRLKVYLRDKGVRYDVIEAVLMLKGDDLVDIVNRTHALQNFLETQDGADLLAGYKRAANILKAETKKSDLPTGEIGTLSQDEAQTLYTELSKTKIAIASAVKSEQYSEAMRSLSQLRKPIDSFFEHVTVNDDMAEVRANNLRLLSLICDTAMSIADFDAIQTS